MSSCEATAVYTVRSAKKVLVVFSKRQEVLS